MPRPRLDRPLGPSGRGTSSARMSSSARMPASRHSTDTLWRHSNQPAASSSYSAATGAYSGNSAAAPWPQPNKPDNSSFASQSSGTFPTPSRYPPNPPPTSGFQQQNLLSGQTTPQQNLWPNQMASQQNLFPNQAAPVMSKPGDGVLASQSALPGSNAYGWSKATSADEWQTHAQWSWPSSQPLQYTVCYLYIYYVWLTAWCSSSIVQHIN